MRRIAVFRADWLPASETFIRNQMNYLTMFEPLAVGLGHVSSSLTRRSDTLIMRNPGPLRIRRILFKIVRRNDKLNKFLIREKIQLIHAHFGSDAVLIAPIAKRLKIPLVVTFHGYDATKLAKSKGIQGIVYRRRLQELFTTSNQIIAVSAFIRTQLLALGAPPEKVVVHYMGIPSEESPSDSQEAEEGIVFIGRLSQKKGADDLLTAYAHLPEGLRKVHPLKMIGTGPLDSSLKETATRLGVRVDFTGWLSPADCAKSIGRAAIICVPSKTADDGDTEGLPTVILEAARASKAIVSTHHAGIPEFIHHGENGILVEEGCVDQLTQQIAILLDNDALREELGNQARVTLMDQFDSVKQGVELEAIYGTAIN